MEGLNVLFVKYHRDVLIQYVTSVMPIANALKDNGIIHQDTYSSIQRASTCKDQMALLFDALNDDRATSCFYNALKTEMSDLVKNCEHQDAQFVKAHSADLIQRVSSVLAIADELKVAEIIHREIYSQIQVASTPQAKMRELLGVLSTDKAKSAFYNLLRDLDKYLAEELEQQGPPPQTPNDNGAYHQSGETEKSQDMTDQPKDDVIGCIPTSVKYRSKIEKFRKDRSKKKVGNIYFSRKNIYIIGSGGSGVVYLGLKEDGTEVAIKRINKDQVNSKDFENELKHLRDLKHESKNIVRYVDLAEDEDFYYLALQLCEYDLEDYMENLRRSEQSDKETALRKIVKEMLLGVQVLHNAGVIHRDIKPKNVLIDSGKNARLADFGLSRKLEEGRSTAHTVRAGTQGWEATEILNLKSEKGDYKKSSDIQVAGMLVYYILSVGKHPFGDRNREESIRKGEYCLEQIQDVVTKDLIEWMINKDPAKRLTIDEVLQHPYFWDDERQDAVLRKLGDRPEVQIYETLAILHELCVEEQENKEETDPPAKLTINQAISQLKLDKKRRDDILNTVGEDTEKLRKLFNTVAEVTEGKTFSNWKSERPNIWTDLNKKPPEDVLGLLRVLRNKLVHERGFEVKKICVLFPDFFISLHRLATDLSWKY